MSAAEKYAMNNNKDTEAKKRLKFNTCYCPVCEKPRQKGNHAQCSGYQLNTGQRQEFIAVI